MSRISTSCYLTQGDYTDIVLGNTTVANRGCGVCTLAMFLLSKYNGNITDTLKAQVVSALANSSLFTTEGNMKHPPQSTSFRINGTSCPIGYTKTSDIAARILEDKVGFVHFSASDGKKTASHFVLVDGINPNENDPLKKLLVVDPAYGDSRTLYSAMVQNYSDSELSGVTPSTTHLNTNLKCVFD